MVKIWLILMVIIWLMILNNMVYQWLLVGGWALPLWKLMEFVSWDDDIPNWMENHKSHVPNHQSDQNWASMAKVSYFMTRLNKNTPMDYPFPMNAAMFGLPKRYLPSLWIASMYMKCEKGLKLCLLLYVTPSNYRRMHHKDAYCLAYWTNPIAYHQSG